MPQTLNSKSQNPEPWTLNPKPSILDPKTQEIKTMGSKA
jgi:hypothetical protein